MKLKVTIDDKAVQKAFDDFRNAVKKRMDEVGKQAVEYAIEHGDYHNVTGRLRQSNGYEVSDKGLRVFNTAPYAEDVQNRGYDVINGAALFAQYELQKDLHL